MSQDILEMMQNMDLKTLESQLALQCAPVLAGLKISNLLTLPKTQKEMLESMMEHTGMSYYVWLEEKEKLVVLVYRKNALKQYLAKDEVRAFLKSMAYPDADLSVWLSIVAKRYQKYMTKKGSFPHEMGLFLGYPIEDVEGFIVNDGKNFLCTGYWKVYKNKQEKTDLFRQFERAKEWLILLLSNGMDLMEAMEILRKGHLYSLCL